MNLKTFATILLSVLFYSSFAQNQLRNPGFEESESDWNLWGGEISLTAKEGKRSLKVFNREHKWSGADQIVFMPEGVVELVVSGWMKVDSVKRGNQPWEQARISVELLNEAGALEGGYPPVVGQRTGTRDWTFYSNTYPISTAVRSVKVFVGLGNASGTAYFDELTVQFKDKNGDFLDAELPSGPVDEGNWYAFEVQPALNGSHYVDWSNLLDAPAGKHGFLQTSGNKVVFEDGTPAKFWGVNLVGGNCFPSKKTADSLATRLSKMGCNLVRFHHMDAPWADPNIFNSGAAAEKLSPESLDKLDYLIHALKKKGIYTFLDLLVHRDFNGLEGVEHDLPDLGGKQVGYFHDKVIEYQVDYAQQLLSHKNPYTKLHYYEEPAIIASEFINESSAFLHFGGDILNEPYRKMAQEKFEKEYPGKKLSSFGLDYGTGNSSPSINEKDNTRGDVKESIAFYNNIERKYYQYMYDQLREAGAKYLLAGSNFPIPVLANQYNNTKLDFIITNEYWDHPQIWKIDNDWSRILYAPIENLSMLKNPQKNIMLNISKFRWADKPLMVTEYNICYPNEYALEGFPFAAAYASLQGFDGMMEFDFDSTMPGGDELHPFMMSRLPEQVAQWVVAAPMFLRGDIKQAPGLVTDFIKPEQWQSLPLYSDFLDKNFYLPFVTKVAKTTDSTAVQPIGDFASFHDADKKVIKSETGELALDYGAGVMQIRSENVQGVTGGLKGQKFSFPFMDVEVQNSWASVLVVSADGKPLSESKKVYLVTTTPIKATGQKYNYSRKGITDAGKLPLLVQEMEGQVTFKRKAKFRVYPLTIHGDKKARVRLKDNKLDTSKGKTFVYEVKVR
ncbi:carbohydrate binding domain-containing protein [Cytophagaceae bacterium ABcell3]|nr:carbohydrate binding domain-containing protein [Cytophagaceae bacterium ABcell3]